MNSLLIDRKPLVFSGKPKVKPMVPKFRSKALVLLDLEGPIPRGSDLVSASNDLLEQIEISIPKSAGSNRTVSSLILPVRVEEASA